MRRAKEPAFTRDGAPINVKTNAWGRDPLDALVDATPADRLGWDLLEQGFDPAAFELADAPEHPGTIVVRAMLRATTGGLSAVWWDASAGKAVGLCVGTHEDMEEASAVLEALTAAGRGDLPLAPPGDHLDLWTVIGATAQRLGLAVRSRSWMSGNHRNISAIFAVRDWLASEEAAGVDLKTSDCAVLLALVLHMSRDGKGGYPGIDRIAAMVRLSRRTVMAALWRLRDAGMIIGEVEHPHSGTAQVWRLSDWFVAVLTPRQEGTRQRAPLGSESRAPADTYRPEGDAETTTEQRASARPKQTESKSSSSDDPKPEDHPNLWRASVEESERRKRAGRPIRSIGAYARPIFKEKVAEQQHREAEIAATREAQKLIDSCTLCDQNANRWFYADGTSATRDDAGTWSDRCGHTEADAAVDDLERAANVASFPGAEVVQEAAG